jgi:WD40 repeat protein
MAGSLAVSSAQSTAEPVLRINAGMHIAKIRRVAVDTTGRYLVTAAEDKTARVWDLASARLLNTLRPPLGDDKEGELYATAISPDGNTVALGGFTQDGDPSVSLYLHDRASGRLIKRLPDFPSIIVDLAWSSSGRYLAVCLNANGVRVYRTDSWEQVGSDTDYARACSGMDFGLTDKLIVSSSDGQLRLYSLAGDHLKLLTKASAPGGKQPQGVRFAPDGSKIAVGFNDTPKVDVLDAATLRLLYEPDTASVNNGNLGSVAWSADGKTLFAAGLFQMNRRTVVRRWSSAKNSPPKDESVAGNAILDLRATPSGEVVFAAADPAWGVLSASGVHSRLMNGPTADYRDNFQNLSLSEDGSIVSFGYALNGKFPARFDLDNGLVLGDPSKLPLSPPITDTTGFNVADWKNGTAPKLNGTALAINPYDKSRSLAIAPDGEGLVLGTNESLHLYNAAGKSLWEISTPGIAWAVNISGDGRYVVAAFDDGTIRWFARKDGKERLAFFPHADKKRWVAWTPSGYYNASVSGEDLIGWHVGQGKDRAADFFGASRFRARFYRPDMIAKILGVDSEERALRQADKDIGRTAATPAVKVQNVLPPVVQIFSPQDTGAVSNQHVLLTYNVRTPDDAPVSKIRVRVNGQAVALEESRNLVVGAEDSHTVTVSIPAQDCEIQLFAENKNGVSAPSTVRVTWKGAVAVKEDAPQSKPQPQSKLYMLVVGVSKYDKKEYQLEFAAKDAVDFSNAMKAQKGGLYQDVEVRLLTDREANRDSVLAGLKWLQTQVTRRDVGVLFLAGHGINDSDQTFYYLPANADVSNLKSTGVVFTEIRSAMANMQGRSLFFVDACYSGNVLGSRRGTLADMNLMVNDMTSEENGVVVFSSSTRKQYSQESAEWNNGAFTKALVEGVNGKADYKRDGRITYKELDVYLATRVTELTSGQQTPVTQAPGGVPDFAVAMPASKSP